MGSFGEDLRAARMSRGVALEKITEVTKISQRHLIALEQGKFRQLPGGILAKGIVRGYAGAVGLDERDWTDRFVQACSDSGEHTIIEESGWTAFAANVGRDRLERRQAREVRLRWIGAIGLLLIVAAAAFLTVRYYGQRSAWWSSLMPGHHSPASADAGIVHAAERNTR
jgi:cytoskeleton protein RodZ